MRPVFVDNHLKEPVVYFCKDCGKLVAVEALGNKFAYICVECGTRNVAFGTEKSIRNFYRVAEPGHEIKMSEAEKKAMNADKL